MDANKIVIGLLLAAVIVVAAVLGVNALSGKDKTAKYAWKDYGYDPATVPAYTVTGRSVKGGEGSPKLLSLRVSVPTDTPPPAIRNAMLDAVRTATMGDKALDAAVVLADYDDDPAKGAEFSALKAVWGPGGEAAAASANAMPYCVNFITLDKPRKKPVVAKPDAPKNPFESGDGTVGMEFGGGG